MAGKTKIFLAIAPYSTTFEGTDHRNHHVSEFACKHRKDVEMCKHLVDKKMIHDNVHHHHRQIKASHNETSEHHVEMVNFRKLTGLDSHQEL